jgi:phage/plasmid-like protein (TIGR03299 family)
MSHDLAINQKTGEASFVHSKLTPAWHGLGTNFGRRMTKEEVLEMSGLDYTVVKKPLYIHRNHIRSDGKVRQRYLKLDRNYETLRTDTEDHLGIVGKRYEVFQNEDAFAFFEELIKEGDMIYESAGAINDGGLVWVLAKMPDYVTVADDPIEKFMVFINSHDGSMPITAGMTPVRIVCHNTLRYAVNHKQSSMVKVRHTARAMDRLQEAHRILNIASDYYDNLGQLFGEMQGFKMNTEMVNKYFKLVIPDPKPKNGEEEVNNARQENLRRDLFEVYETSPAIVNTSAYGNMYGAVNALTEFIDHHRPVRGDEMDRFESLIVNDNNSSAIMRRKTFNLAVDFMRSNGN